METVGNQSTATPSTKEQSMAQLMGLAVFGEKAAAKNYSLIAQLLPPYASILNKFAAMEAKHAADFLEISQVNHVLPDKAFADRELGYLIDQVEEYFAKKDHESLMILQGFIVESLAIATYEPFIDIADEYPGSREAVKRILQEEFYHVDWITRYLRLQYFDRSGEFISLAEKVNRQGVDCVGGSMMNIADALTTVGIPGADCAGIMIDTYTRLLENVGVDQEKSQENVLEIFLPLIRKYRKISGKHSGECGS